MTLNQRLNGWYGAVLLLTMLLGAAVSELVAERLAARRYTELHQRVLTQVSGLYPVRGLHSADEVQVPGVDVRITDAEGRTLGRAPPVSPVPDMVVSTRLDQDRWLETSVPDSTVAATRRDARLALLGGGGVMIALALLGGWAVTRRALLPIRQVTETAAAIVEHGVSDARVPAPNTHDELEAMVGLFNRLLDTEQAMIEQMRTSLDSIGHDLRTPLTRIRAAGELALERDDREDLVAAVEVALEESSAVEQLLTRLLDLTRAEAGMMQLERASLDPADCIERVAALYEHVAEDQGVALQVQAPLGEARIDADRARLEQALANLVDNALKLAPPGSVVSLGLRREADRVGIEVRDQGPGIEAHHQQRVFERLYRGDASRNQPGAGLGLAMVRAIAVAHGGEVTLVSEPGQGAVFTIWLPIDEAPAAS